MEGWARQCASALTVCALTLAIPATASASALQSELDDWMVRLEDRDPAIRACFAQVEDRKVNYRAIPPTNPHVSPRVLALLNEMVENAAPRSWSLRSAAAVGRDVMSGSFGDPRLAPQERLRNLNESQIRLDVTIKRDTVRAARLEVEVTLFRPDGSRCDSTRRRWHVDPWTGERVDRPSANEPVLQVLEYDPALRLGLSRVEPRNTTESAIGYRVVSAFDGATCPLAASALERDVAGAALALNDPTTTILTGQRRTLFALTEREADAVPHIEVAVSRSPRVAARDRDRVVVLDFTWREGDRRWPSQSHTVAFPMDALADCASGPRDDIKTVAAGASQPGRYSVAMSVPGNPFAVGDAMELTLRVDEPVNPYCWVILEEGAVLLYPHNPRLAARQFVAGSYRFPRDFALPDIPLKDAGTLLFHCFLNKGPMPADLQDRWLTTFQSGAYVPWKEVHAMLETFRRVPTVSEISALVRAVGS
ncbi:MAG: hypothetical protein ROR55_09290 [Devosia sp.]